MLTVCVCVCVCELNNHYESCQCDVLSRQKESNENKRPAYISKSHWKDLGGVDVMDFCSNDINN